MPKEEEEKGTRAQLFLDILFLWGSFLLLFFYKLDGIWRGGIGNIIICNAIPAERLVVVLKGASKPADWANECNRLFKYLALKDQTLHKQTMTECA